MAIQEVDYNPFAPAAPANSDVTPVDHDPFAAPSQGQDFPSLIRTAGEKSPMNAVSPKGARSDMQVEPYSAARPGYGVTPAKDNSVEEYHRVGVDYANKMQEIYADPTLASIAYNAGPGKLNQWLVQFGDPRSGQISMQDFLAKIPYKETQAYAERIQAAAHGTPSGGVTPVEGDPFAGAKTKPVDIDPFAGQKDIGIGGEFSRGALEGTEAVGKSLNTQGVTKAAQTTSPVETALETMFPPLAGAKAFLQGLGLLGTAPPAPPTKGSEPISFKGPLDVHSVAEKIAHGAGQTVPVVTAASAGGIPAAAELAYEQTYGPKLAEEQARNPNDPVGNHEKAVGEATVDAAATAMGWKLFEFTPFKHEVGQVINDVTGEVSTVFKKTIADTIKNIAAQGLAIQPAVSMVNQAVNNLIDGRPIMEGLPQQYVQGGIANTLMMGVTHLIHPPGLERSPFRAPAAGETTPYNPSGLNQGPIIDQGGPPGRGPAGAAAQLPSPPPPAGSDIGLRSPDGSVQRATVEAYGANGSTVKVRYEDGTTAEHLTSEVMRDRASPPALRFETEPEPPKPYQRQLGPDEGKAPAFGEAPPEEPGRRAAAKIASRQPQPVMDPQAIHALDLANRLEQAATDPGNPMSTADRMAALMQVARLRQSFTPQGEESRPAGYRNPVAGEPAKDLGELGVARVAQPENYEGQYVRQPFAPSHVQRDTLGLDQAPYRPPDLIQFLSRNGGITANDPYSAGNLQQMDAHLKFVPGAGMLVRKNGGKSIEKAREAAAEAGYGVGYNNFETNDDLLDAIKDSLGGKDVFSHTENGGIQAAMAWQAYKDSQRMGPQDEQEDRDNTAELRDKAEHYGIPVGEDWSAEDLMAAVAEREAVMAERDHDSHAAAQHLADAQELNIDHHLAVSHPEYYAGLRGEGVADEDPFGHAEEPAQGQPATQPEAPAAVGEHGGEGTPGKETGPPGPGGHPGDRGEAEAARAEAHAEPVEQPLIEAPAETAKERQAREGKRRIEESQQLPRAHKEKVQKPADEGLFTQEPLTPAGDLVRLAEENVNPEPSEAQIEAGNYKKGHVTVGGVPVSIETPAGGVRRGVGPDGKPWSVTLQYPYGDVKGSKGADGDKIDVYIGPHPDSPDAFVIDQIDPKTGDYDEHKAVLGARTEEQAREIYDAGFSDGSGPERAGAITAMPVDEFKEWAESGPKREPLAYQPPVIPSVPPQDVGRQAADDLKTAAATADVRADPVADEREQIIDENVPTNLPEALDDVAWKPAGEAEGEPPAAGRADEAGQPVGPAGGEAEGRPVAAAKPEGGGHPPGESIAPRAGERPVDSDGKPIFKKGERVVLTSGDLAGRHGVVDEVMTSTMRPLFGGPETVKTSHYYTIRTDEGAREMAGKIEPETSPPAKVIKDPIWEDQPITPDALRRTIEYARKSVNRFKDSAERARLPQKKAAWRQSAEIAQKKADAAQGVLAAWERQNPDLAKKPEAAVLPPDSAIRLPDSAMAGVKVTENKERNGVEVRFPGRPSDEVLGKLKAAGFRWSKPQKLWYAKRSDRTLAVANSLKGGAEPSKSVEIRQEPTVPVEKRELKKGDHVAFTVRHNGRDYPLTGTITDTYASDPTAVVTLTSKPERSSYRVGMSMRYLKDKMTLTQPERAFTTTPGAIAAEHAAEVSSLEAQGTVAASPANKARAADIAAFRDKLDRYGAYHSPRGDYKIVEVGFGQHHGYAVEVTEGGIRTTLGGVAHQGLWSRDKAVQEAVERAYPNPGPTERAADTGAAEGARAEMDESIYQPAAMPITAAAPPPKKPPAADLFSRGDAVQPKPENAGDLPPRPGARYVTDVSPDGRQVTLDGGAILPSTDVEPTLEHGLQEPVRSRPAGKRPEAISGVGEVGPNRPISAGKEPGSAQNAGRPAGARTEGTERTPTRRPGAETGRGAGDVTDVGLPSAGEGPEPGTSGRPDAHVRGENFQIQPGELDEGRGPKAKASDNLAAINLVKRLMAEDRPATRDEQAILARYVGWGGLSGAFQGSDGRFGTGFEDIGRELKDALTPEEYQTASRSTQYAHYTAENVIRSMWDAVAAMGFDGGNIFEPGMGVGHFLGLMPPDIAAKSQYEGIELDHLTADIASHIYPRSGVRQADFTQTPMPENTFDLVIGNPPFSDTIIKADPKYAARGFMLHDYFFAKSLDSVRPGGLLAFVTSAGTMNKLDDSARTYLAGRAQFLGGVRLPSNAFKKNAGTEVTTDVLFFQKHPEELLGKLQQIAQGDLGAWTETIQRSLPNAEGKTTKGNVSRYFSEHPEMVLGREGFFDKLYKDRYAVHADDNSDLTEAMQRAMSNLPRDIYKPPATPTEKAEMDFASGERKDGSFYMKDGKLMQYDGGVGRAVERRGAGVEGGVTAPDHEKITRLIPIRDALRDVLSHDLAERPAEAAVAREQLNRAYDAFTRKYGPINKVELQYRRPNVIQQEYARAEEREMARDRGEQWREGTFNGDIQGKTIQEVARLRADARTRHGPGFDEGSFDPAEMQDIVIEKRPNIDPFMDDQESYRLRAIEEYDDTTKLSKKKRVFFESDLTKEQEPVLNSANDGVLWSLNKLGRFDVDAIAQKMGRERQDIIGELGDKVFKVPGTDGTYQTSDEYLSGDIINKLDDARAAAQHDPEVRRNIPALEAAVPAPLAPSEITMNLGMPWIPPQYVEEFSRDHLRIGEARIRHNAALGGWMINPISDGPDNALWGVEDFGANKILIAALNRIPPRLFSDVWENGEKKSVFDPVLTQAAQDKYEAMRTGFQDWTRADAQRHEDLAGIYNNALNRTVLRVHDGSYLTTPGVSKDWTWRPHQLRGVARVIQTGNTYLAHAVGSGKTSLGIGAIMEMRRLGLVSKPMVPVPKHVLGQWAKEWYEQYPTAKIMVADERRFHTSRRKQFIANAARSDVDAIIIPHSSFGFIPISDRFQSELIKEELDHISDALKGLDKQDDRITIKRLENMKEQLEQKLRGAMSNRKDQTNTFEEMGVDFLFVDEAHLFRKLQFATRQSSLKGIDPDGSKKAWDLYSKIRYLESKRPGRSAVLASGTPVVNTMGELYSISKYLQRPELQDRGIDHFDSWASTFGDTAMELEQTADGGYQSVNRFSRFVNIPELYKMVGQVMDSVTPSQLSQYVVRPKIKGGKRALNLADRSDAMIEYQGVLANRMAAIKARRGLPKKGDDILPSVITSGTLAAIDMRLVDPEAENDPDSKLNRIIAEAYRIYKDKKDTQFYDPASNYKTPTVRGPATLMIFSNVGIGGKEGKFSAYAWMKRELLRLGVAPTELAFIKDYKSQIAKQKLFNDMNEGKVRILIGSTDKMGTGVNAQKRLYGILNQDPMWNPAPDEQRLGRGLRQGNMNPEIEIIDFSTKGTYDFTKWQMMGRKARFIEQFFRGDPELRDMEDLGEASQYEQIAAMSTTDPRIMELTQLRQDLDKAVRREAAHDREQYSMRQQLSSAHQQMQSADRKIPIIQADIAKRALPKADEFRASIAGKNFTNKTEAAEALRAHINEKWPTLEGGKELKLGEYGGFPFSVLKSNFHLANPDYFFRRSNGDASELSGQTPIGVIRSMENRVAGFEQEIKYLENNRAAAEAKIASLEAQIGKPFTGGDEIRRLRQEVRDLETDLAPKKPEEGVVKAQVPKEVAAKPFYSALTRSVEAIKQEKAPAAQWSGIIDNLKTKGVKQEEIDWSGVKDWLAEQKGSVTKAAVIDFLRDNEIQVKEVMHGGKSPADEDKPAPGIMAEQRYHELDRKVARGEALTPSEKTLMQWLDANPDSGDLEYLTREYDLWLDDHKHLPRMSADELGNELGELQANGKRSGPEIQEEINWLAGFSRRWEDASNTDRFEGSTIAPRFQSYTLPGGENYTELLLTLPEGAPRQVFSVRGRNGDWVGDFDTKEKAQEWADSRNRQNRGMGATVVERTKPAESTYLSGHWDEPNILAHIRFDDRTGPNGEKILHVAEFQSDWHQQGRKRGYAEKITKESAEKAGYSVDKAMSSLGNEAYFADGPEIPRGVVPNVGQDTEAAAWDALLSRLQEYNNKSNVPNAPFKTTWPELAFKRMLRYAAENGYDRLSWDTGETNAERYNLSKYLSRVDWIPNTNDYEHDHEGTLQARDRKGAVVITEGMKASEIADHVGKDVAEKLLTGENLERMKAGLDAKVEGLDLKVGGEGMAGFYDKILPDFVRKYVKKWGAKVEDSTIDASRYPGVPMEDENGNEVPEKKTPVHSVTITPKMRDSVMAGQPLFQRTEPTIWADIAGTKRLAPDFYARMPRTPSEGEAHLIEQVSRILKQITPGAKVIPAKELIYRGDKIWGATYTDGGRMMIAWALGGPSPTDAAHHEAVHWLRNLGFFRPGEWEDLSNAAINDNWLNKHNIRARYSGLDFGSQVEEAIAEEYADWARRETTPPPKVRSVFGRLRELLRRVAKYLRSLYGDTVKADEIFSKIMSGEIGSREPMDKWKPSAEVFAQAAKTPEGPPETPQEGRDYIDATAQDLAEQMRGKGRGTYERTLQHLTPSRGPEIFKRANWAQREFVGPRTVAEIDTKSGRFWAAIQKEDDEANTRLHDLRDNIRNNFLKLPRENQDRVNAVMELDRLDNRTRSDDGRSIIARNTNFADARGSKPGESIILTPEETKAYFGLQHMYREAWDNIMEGSARRMGWSRAWSPSMADNFKELERAISTADGQRNRKAFQRIHDVLSAMEEQRRAAYMPLMRFGDYYFSVTPKYDKESTGGFPESRWFSLAERPSLQYADVDPMKMLRFEDIHINQVPSYAKDEMAMLQAKFPGKDFRINHGYLLSKPDMLRQMSIPAIEKLMMLLESGVMDRMKTEASMEGFANKGAAYKKAKEDWGNLYEELVDAVRDEMYEQLKAGFKKRSRTIPGYSGDWNRVVGTYMGWTSRHVARQIHGDTVERLYDDIQASHPDEGIKQFWREWKQDDDNPTSPLSRIGMAANQIGFLWTMALNPASTFSIAMHGPTYAIPTLGTGIGTPKSAAAFAKAYGEATIPGVTLRWDDKHGAVIDTTKVGKTPDERAFLKNMEAAGYLHAKGADDIRSMAEKSSAIWGDYTPHARQIMDIASSNIAVADQANRVAASLAAYRLARDGNLGHMNATWGGNQVWRAISQEEGVSPESMGKFLLNQSVGEWGGRSRTKFGRSFFGRMMSSLHGFQVRFISNWLKQAFRQGGAGRIAAAWSLAALWAAAGTQGLFLVQDAENGIDAIWKLITKHDPMLAWRLRAMLVDTGLGKTGADMIMRGPLSTATGIDFGSRLGFGDIITRDVVPLFGMADQAVLTFPSIVFGAMRAFSARKGSHQSAAAAASLLPGALRHPAQAIIDAEHGVKSQSGKHTYVPKRKFTPLDEAKEAAGFTPLDVARAREHTEFQYRAKNAHGKRPPDTLPR